MKKIGDISDGLFIFTQEDAIAEQESWDEEDPGKEIDFTTSLFWLLGTGDFEPDGFDSEKELIDYVRNELGIKV